MAEKKTILIVDDDSEILQMLTFFIKSIGYLSETKENASLAKEWLSSNKPDLILLDVMLPDMTGIEFCRWVQSQENVKSTPIIHMTALLDDDIAQQDSMLAGARDFITKPIDLQMLEKKIKALLVDKKDTV